LDKKQSKVFNNLSHLYR